MSLLKLNKSGLYCAVADVYIDAWRAVERCVVTHAHADHARYGHAQYFAHQDSEPTLRLRLGKNIELKTFEYGQQWEINGVKFSLHPAGHVIGSAQVRVEHQGEVWVVSGDYKLQVDGLTTPFEVVPCDVFITEATFGLPVFKWQPQSEIVGEIEEWWQQNQKAGRASLLSVYSLGKAQRVLHALDNSLGPIFSHGSIFNTNAALRAHGISLPVDQKATLRNEEAEDNKALFSKGLILAPQSAFNSNWVRRFGKHSIAAASGWMQIRGIRRRAALDRGFVLSDHADWNDLIKTIYATGATKIYVTHGYTAQLSSYLREMGLDAEDLQTDFGVTED